MATIVAKRVCFNRVLMCVPFSAEINVFNTYNSVLICFKGSGANAPLPTVHIMCVLYVLKTIMSAKNGTRIRSRLCHARLR